MSMKEQTNIKQFVYVELCYAQLIRQDRAILQIELNETLSNHAEQ